jgi:hypothetical protein
MTKQKLNAEQKAAVKAYQFALKQEDRYLGSVFVTPARQREMEDRTSAAANHCRSLGVKFF